MHVSSTAFSSTIQEVSTMRGATKTSAAGIPEQDTASARTAQNKTAFHLNIVNVIGLSEKATPGIANNLL